VLLADNYIHVEFSAQENFNALAERLESAILSASREIFKKDAKIEYLLEEGTLIQRTRIFKTLALILGGIAGYHELRESVIDIYNDADAFAHIASELFHKITDTSPSAVIYKRVLPSDVKHLHRIIENVDRITDHTTKKEERAITEDIASDIAGLYYSDPEDKGPQLILHNLPKRKLPDLPATIPAIIQIEQRRRRTEALNRPEKADAGPPHEARPRRRRYVHTTTI
jgi:hypothetical protein